MRQLIARAAPSTLLLAVLCALTANTTATAATRHGVSPTVRSHRVAGAVPGPAQDIVRRRRRAARIAAARLQHFGGPVLHANRTHVIYWAPAGSGLTYEPGYQGLVQTFLADVAAGSRSPANVYGLTGQYTDRHGAAAYSSTYGGASATTDPLPANGCSEPATTGPGWSICLTDAQIQGELERVVSTQHLPLTPTDVYFLVLPNGFGNCTNGGSDSCALGGGASGYCGYHSEAGNGLLYAVIPYNAVPGHCQSDNPRPNRSTADPALSSLSHEHNEMVTDPDAVDGWITADGQENGDLCITDFGPVIGGSGSTAWNEAIGGGHWFLQEEWSNEDGGCAARDEPARVALRVPARGRTGHVVAMSVRATDPDGAIVGVRWFFGDGRTATGRTVHHVFSRAGRYRVAVRVLDAAENWTVRTATVRVRAR